MARPHVGRYTARGRFALILLPAVPRAAADDRPVFRTFLPPCVLHVDTGPSSIFAICASNSRLQNRAVPRGPRGHGGFSGMHRSLRRRLIRRIASLLMSENGVRNSV